MTESQLYGLVEQAINELNWKTYMNASRKASQKGQRKNREQFLRAAKDSFKREYNMNDRKGSSDVWMGLHKQEDLPNGDHAETLTSFYPWWDEEPYKFDMNADYNIYDKDNDKNKQNVGGEYGRYAKEGNHTQRSYSVTRPSSNNSAAFTDVNNYLDGKSKYIQGKGWSNESIAHRITESVMRKLRESAEDEPSVNKTSYLGNYLMRIFEDNYRAYVGWMPTNEKHLPNGISVDVDGQEFQGTVEVTLNAYDLFDVSFIQNGQVVDKLEDVNVSVLMMEMDKKINGGHLTWERR